MYRTKDELMKRPIIDRMRLDFSPDPESYAGLMICEWDEYHVFGYVFGKTNNEPFKRFFKVKTEKLKKSGDYVFEVSKTPFKLSQFKPTEDRYK